MVVLFPSCRKGEVVHSMAEGKTDWYETEEELREAASLIVKVKKTEKEKNVSEYLGVEDFYHGYTLSDVEIEVIEKNDTGKEISVGDSIRVLENQFSYKARSGNTVVCHVNQYTMMIPDKEYYLYLEFSETDQWYVPIAGFLGKVNVDEKEDLLFPASELSSTGTEYIEDEYIVATMRSIQQACLQRYE